MSVITQNSDKICSPGFACNHPNERVHVKYRQYLWFGAWSRQIATKVRACLSALTRLCNQIDFLTYLGDSVCIFTMILSTPFLSLFTVFLKPGANAPRAPYFLSVSLERNTLPLTGAWGGWVVGGLLDVGCWVWIIGFDSIHIYIYIQIKPKPLKPPIHPILGSSFGPPSGKTHVRKMHPKQIGLSFLRSPRLLPVPRGVRPYQLDYTTRCDAFQYDFTSGKGSVANDMGCIWLSLRPMCAPLVKTCVLCSLRAYGKYELRDRPRRPFTYECSSLHATLKIGNPACGTIGSTPLVIFLIKLRYTQNPEALAPHIRKHNYNNHPQLWYVYSTYIWCMYTSIIYGTPSAQTLWETVHPRIICITMWRSMCNSVIIITTKTQSYTNIYKDRSLVMLRIIRFWLIWWFGVRSCM